MDMWFHLVMFMLFCSWSDIYVGAYVSIYIYIYRYIHTHMHLICIQINLFIYIYIERLKIYGYLMVFGGSHDSGKHLPKLTPCKAPSMPCFIRVRPCQRRLRAKSAVSPKRCLTTGKGFHLATDRTHGLQSRCMEPFEVQAFYGGIIGIWSVQLVIKW